MLMEVEKDENVIWKGSFQAYSFFKCDSSLIQLLPIDFDILMFFCQFWKFFLGISKLFFG